MKWFNFLKNPHKRDSFITFLLIVFVGLGFIYADAIAAVLSDAIFGILELLGLTLL